MNWHSQMQPSGPTQANPDMRHQVAFVRGGHTWRLTWNDGDEPLLLETLAALAASPDCPLDDFDRALVHQHLAPAASSSQNRPPE